MHGLIFETSISLLAGSTRYLIKKNIWFFWTNYITTQNKNREEDFLFALISKSIRVFQSTVGLFLLWHSHKQPFLMYQKKLLFLAHHRFWLVSITPISLCTWNLNQKLIWFKYQHHHCELSPLRLASEQRFDSQMTFSKGSLFCRTIQYGYKFPFLLSQVDERVEALSSRPPFLQLLWMEPQWGSTINGNASRCLNKPTEWWGSKLATNSANCCYFTFLFWSTCLHIDTWARFFKCNPLQLYLLQHLYEIVLWWNKKLYLHMKL